MFCRLVHSYCEIKNYITCWVSLLRKIPRAFVTIVSCVQFYLNPCAWSLLVPVSGKQLVQWLPWFFAMCLRYLLLSIAVTGAWVISVLQYGPKRIYSNGVRKESWETWVWIKRPPQHWARLGIWGSLSPCLAPSGLPLALAVGYQYVTVMPVNNN